MAEIVSNVAMQIQFTGSVTNMSVVDFAIMHIENATDAIFNNFTFTGNIGASSPAAWVPPFLPYQLQRRPGLLFIYTSITSSNL